MNKKNINRPLLRRCGGGSSLEEEGKKQGFIRLEHYVCALIMTLLYAGLLILFLLFLLKLSYFPPLLYLLFPPIIIQV